MTILFDLIATQPIRNNVHGGGEYAKVVFMALLDKKPDKKIVAFYDKNRPIDQAIMEKANACGVELIAVAQKSDIQAVIRSTGKGTFFSALPYSYHSLDFCDLTVVFTIHGLRAIEIATDWYEHKYVKGVSGWLKWVAKTVFRKPYVKWRLSQFGQLLTCNAKQLQIIVPSEHTKYSILSSFPDFDAAKINVLYSPATAVGSEACADTATLAKYGLSERGYILLVSGKRWVKNSYRALVALDRIERNGELGKKAILTGGAPSRIPGRWRTKFTFLPYLSQGELVALYESAYCLLYPTLNEGFGYPPLEAMRHGTPVICSAITSTTEILGDAPLYFSPYSSREMENRVLSLLFSEQLWATKSKQSTDRYELILSQQREMLHRLCEIIAT